MKIHTYIDHSVPSRTNQRGLIELWKTSWAARGWEPVVLTPDDLPRDAASMELRRFFRYLPTVNHPHYEAACYDRWLAMAHAGAGWMSDADVMNYGFAPKFFDNLLDSDRIPVVCDRHVPCLVFGSAAAYFSMAKKFAERANRDGRWIQTIGGCPHTSDMIIIESLTPGVDYVPLDFVKEYREDGWEKAPLVHFATGRCYPADKVNVINEHRRP